MQALNNALVPQIIGPGLNISINQGVVLINGVDTLFPNTIVGLTANTTTYIFINIGAAVLQSNNSGFPSNSYPIATVTSTNTGVAQLLDNRPDYALTSPISVNSRFILSFGTALTPGNFSLINWGSGATITVNGKDSAHQITVTAGTGATQGAQVQLTFADGAWNSAPLVYSAPVSTQTGMILVITSTSTTITYTLTFNGLPISGKTYIANILVCGLS
jgi:hypothetical protein